MSSAVGFTEATSKVGFVWAGATAAAQARHAMAMNRRRALRTPFPVPIQKTAELIMIVAPLIDAY
jgi:hypothetical protein